jgi:hypothetical protein
MSVNHGDYLRVAHQPKSNRDHFLQANVPLPNPANFLQPRFLILALQTNFPWCRAIRQEVPRCRSATSFVFGGVERAFRFVLPSLCVRDASGPRKG